jgi:hypothetical protein
MASLLSEMLLGPIALSRLPSAAHAASPSAAYTVPALLVRRQDHRHGLRVDRLDDGIRRSRQESVDEVRRGGISLDTLT